MMNYKAINVINTEQSPSPASNMILRQLINIISLWIGDLSYIINIKTGDCLCLPLSFPHVVY